MGLEIVVDPDAVKDLVENARQIPEDQMADALTKLEDLEDTLNSWKGDGVSGHEEAVTELKDALNSTQTLMTAILATLDTAVENFSDTDDEISAHFQLSVSQFLSD